jgi:hypothetical protein
LKNIKDLPKNATDIFENWVKMNWNCPYPNELDKINFSNITGLSLTQINNWFIN